METLFSWLLIALVPSLAAVAWFIWNSGNFENKGGWEKLPDR